MHESDGAWGGDPLSEVLILNTILLNTVNQRKTIITLIVYSL